ncbi:MAG: nitric oxide reductase activation protein NorD [Planctomycetota bacterium]
MSAAVALAAAHGFDLRRVCWGYREIFADALDALLQLGRITVHDDAVTRALFTLLDQADGQHFDCVLHECLDTLIAAPGWLFGRPQAVAELLVLGGELGRERLYRGIRFFRALRAARFGSEPGALRLLIDTVRRLHAIDGDLAVAFIQGHPTLVGRLRPEEIERYLQAAITAWQRDAKTGCRFMSVQLASCEAYLCAITREARLAHCGEDLTRLLQALTGTAYRLADHTALDADELRTLGSTTLCCGSQLYLPARIRLFAAAEWNRAWYTLSACALAAQVASDSFVRIHGAPGLSTSADLLGDDPLLLNCFAACEYARALRHMIARWPGTRRLLALMLERAEPDNDGTRPLAALIGALCSGVDPAPLGLPLDGPNCLATAQALCDRDLGAVRERHPALGHAALPPPGFLPDFRYPFHPARPPDAQLVAAMRETARRSAAAGDDTPATPQRCCAQLGAADTASVEDTGAAAAAFIYDEWNHQEQTYCRGHCLVHQHQVTAPDAATPPASVLHRAQQVARACEWLRRDAPRRERGHDTGALIDTDRLIAHQAARRHRSAPRVDFFVRPRRRERDLALCVLLDCSGSTGSRSATARILDVEQQAAIILGAGLAALGDPFELAGFDSNGREQCHYRIFKDFTDSWAQARDNVLAATPRGATRIGPALRHAGDRLAAQGRRRGLILLITDGQPQDDGYDAPSRYAHHDVRMACIENLRHRIHTCAIATRSTSERELAIMFPDRRYVIIDTIDRLPRILPPLFARLTAG